MSRDLSPTPSSPPRVLVSPWPASTASVSSPASPTSARLQRTPRLRECLRTVVHEQRQSDAQAAFESQLIDLDRRLETLSELVRSKADGAEVDLLQSEMRQVGAARGKIDSDVTHLREVVQQKADQSDVWRCTEQLLEHRILLDQKLDMCRAEELSDEMKTLRIEIDRLNTDKADQSDMWRLQKSFQSLGGHVEVEDTLISKLQHSLTSLAEEVAQKASTATVEELSRNFVQHRDTADASLVRLDARAEKLGLACSAKAEASGLEALRVQLQELKMDLLPASMISHVEARFGDLDAALALKTDAAHFDEVADKLFSYYEALRAYTLGSRTNARATRPPGRPLSAGKFSRHRDSPDLSFGLGDCSSPRDRMACWAT